MEETRQWEKVKELFDAALHREPARRDAFLSEACGADSSLRAEIDSLLAAYNDSEGLSRTPFPVDFTPEAQPLQSIGPYRLIRKLGEGGMGQVWLAEQSEPLRRQVALKLIRAGVLDQALLARFQEERQSLALMEHPAIARVFDAGATPEGQPYFVMEYVPGEPITKYCDRKKLKIRDRIELFIKACEGVQHAHQKAIIHRDLKPANILVLEVDGQPTPRIIDFGLARAIERKPSAGEAPPRPEALAGTPGYMSPEQARGADIDTRTDVYSLGVVLYELLAGQLPFDAAQWKEQPLTANLRALEDHPTEKPSARAAEASPAAIEAAEHRQTKPRTLAHQLAGDLDLIAMKALEKDRARRYGTPTELATDLRHYLRQEPVTAHPASAAYLAGKYLRRHRVGVAMTALLALLLVGFAGLQAFELRRIARERDRAQRITDFMTGMFRVSDPSEARGNQVTAREILDKASAQITSGLASDPETQTQMMMVMGLVYENLGLYDRSEAVYREASTIRERQLGPDNPETLQSRTLLAWTLHRRGRYREAEALLRPTLATAIHRLGPNSPEAMTAMDYLGVVVTEEGHPAEGEQIERRVVDFRRRTLGNDNSLTMASINNLAFALLGEGKWAEAGTLFREQAAAWQRLQGADSPRFLDAQGNLAITLYRQGRLPEAEALYRQNLATKRRILGPDHPETVRDMNNLTAVLGDEGKLAEAQSLDEQVIAIRTRVLGPDHPLTLSSINNLGEILTHEGKYAQARKLLLQARAAEVRALGPDSPVTALSSYNLACVQLREGHPADALSTLREAVDHGLAAWVVAAMPSDPDLAALHSDPRFATLLAYARQHVAARPRH